MKQFFAEYSAETKFEIATTIGKQFPELAPRVPPFRKPWMSEDYRMSIFDAVAFATSYFSKSTEKQLVSNLRAVICDSVST